MNENKKAKNKKLLVGGIFALIVAVVAVVAAPAVVAVPAVVAASAVRAA